MGVGIDGCILWNTGAEVDARGFWVGSPRIGAHFVSRSGAEPFGPRGETPFFPFCIGVGTRVIDGEYRCIPCDVDLAVVFVPFAGMGENITPIGGLEIGDRGFTGCGRGRKKSFPVWLGTHGS